MNNDLSITDHICVVIAVVGTTIIIFYYSIDSKTEILGLISTSLSAILAIVFAISILAIQVVIEKYNSTVLELFKNSDLTKCTLGIFLFTIIVSIFLSSFITDVKFWNTVCFALFLVSLYCFVHFFYRMLDIINPHSLVKLLTDWAMELISNKDEKANEVVTSIGEIALKTLQKRDTVVTLEYLKVLDELREKIVEGNIDENFTDTSI